MDGDVDTILVQKNPYTKESVTKEGNCTVTDVSGGKKYTFPGGSEPGVLSYGSTKLTIDGKYQIEYIVSTATEVMSGYGAAYYNLSAQGGPGKVQIGTYNGVTIFGNKISGPIFTGYKKSTVEVKKYVNGKWVKKTDPGAGSVTFIVNAGSSTDGGSVTVLSSIPPDIGIKKLVPAVLQQETTEVKRYAPWRYIESTASEAKKTFLVQGQQGSTAIQNFAFDGMDDID